MSNTRKIGKVLDRRGGHARARRLSLEVARRIADNFNYLRAIQELGGRGPSLARVRISKGPLPGLYPDRS